MATFSIPFGIISLEVEANSNNFDENNKTIHNRNSRSLVISVPNDYPTIQKAINNAAPGDIIKVASGTYNEHIFIDKSISLIGDGAKNTTIDGRKIEFENVININTDFVNITGFNIVNSGYSSGGIRFNEVSNVIIDNCSFVNNVFGIYLFKSDHNKIIYNTFYDNGQGFAVWFSDSNLFIKNNISYNGYGFDLGSSNSNIISNNTIWNCSTGLAIRGGQNIVEKNYIWNNFYGIDIDINSENEIHFNNIYNNRERGLNVDSESPVNAINNWWGDSSGPFNANKNSKGKGNKVSNNAEFKPWLLSPFNTNIDFIQIRTASSGKGSVVGNITMTADETLQFWIAAYNHSFGYIGAISVEWNVTGDLDPVPSELNTVIIFSPKNAPTSGTINIKDSNGNINSTGLISVKVGVLDHIEINPANKVLSLNHSQQFTATGYDHDNNIVPISPFWWVNSNCTITQNGSLTIDKVCLGTWKVYANQSDIIGYASVTITINNSADTDIDGMLDWWEVENNLDPFSPSDANLDPDLDGLINLQEFSNGTKPFNNDTDDDSLGDGFELIFSKTDPTTWDSNGNGIGDGLEFLQTQGYTGGLSTLPDGWIGMMVKWSNYTMFVSTNSSVLNVEFDKEKKKVDIIVSGKKGTSGGCRIIVPKSLLNSTEDISISLDNNPLNFTLTQNETYYIISVRYNHSTHALSIDLAESKKGPGNGQNGEDPEGSKLENGKLQNIYIVLSSAIAVIIIILIIVIIRVRKENGYTETPMLPPEDLSNMLEQKHSEGAITDETYNDIRALLEKYRKQ
jgi:parallel beta-helix repeat protein